MRRLSAVLAVQLLLVGLSAGSARADAPACGDVVTSDVTLTSSLTGCADGLVVDADGVTIDLNGHAIAGTGTDSGTGVSIAGRSGVTVRNGAVRGFGTGVRLDDALDSTVERIDVRHTPTGILVNGGARNRLFANTISGASFRGIVASGGDDLQVLHNTVTSSVAGISLRGVPVPLARAVIAHNTATHNALFGIDLFFANAIAVDRNVANGNGGAGFSLTRSNVDWFTRNVANRNGSFGVFSSDSHGRYLGNVTNANGADGLYIEDAIPGHGPLFTLARNRANANGGLGIRAFPGVIDGGGNRARANGDPAQCRDIVCNARGGTMPW